jgi:hypothetical protein
VQAELSTIKERPDGELAIVVETLPGETITAAVALLPL